jgi:hypothetical protein
MFHIRGEGEGIERGINFYPLSDEGSFGFTVRTKKYVYWFRWRKKLKNFSFKRLPTGDKL